MTMHHTVRGGLHRRFAVIAALCLAAAAPAVALADGGPKLGDWTPATKIDDPTLGNDLELNTTSVDGCPIQSPDGLHLFVASNRPDGHGGLDIWVASRERRTDPWGTPRNLPAPVNSTADDFCPTPIEGGGLLFVSRRSVDGVTCGQGDIYITRLNPAQGYDDPTHLPCAPAGPNSDLDEQGPSFVQGQLYFSRSSAAPYPVVPGDLFVSRWDDGTFGPAAAIAELNDGTANDIQPNVRKDGREMVFSSNRSGGQGGQDIWVATRSGVDQPWSSPVNLGTNINTGRGESRPSLSSDGLQLLFGRAGGTLGEGGNANSDVFVSSRTRGG